MRVHVRKHETKLPSMTNTQPMSATSYWKVRQTDILGVNLIKERRGGNAIPSSSACHTHAIQIIDR